MNRQPVTIAPPADGYTSQFLLNACAAAVGGTVILDREAARAWVKSVRTPRTSLPRVGQSFFHVLPQSHPSNHDGLILDAMPGGVIHCRLITPPRRPGWEVIPAALWVRDDGRTASIYGAVPWVSDVERARWSVQPQGWTVCNPHTNEVGAMRQPWPTKEEAYATAQHMPPPSRIGIGD